MGYYDTEKGVAEYIGMAEGYDGKNLIQILNKHLTKGSSILELGMGPGKDFEILQKNFNPTGSDASELFVRRYAELHPKADVLILDAITIKTDRKFDAIYSNKVLQHLTMGELQQSLESQHRVLNPGGIVLHSLWAGTDCETYGEMISQQHTLQTFKAFLSDQFVVIESSIYAEMEMDDSICIVLRKLEE